jgi:hypothetical protein
MSPKLVQPVPEEESERKSTNAWVSRLAVSRSRLLLAVMKKVGIAAPVTLSVAIELFM